MVAAARARLGERAQVVEAGIDALARPLGQFDLILSHSNLRLWSDPARGLRTIRTSLTSEGMAYLLDLRRNISGDLRERLLASIDAPDFRDLYVAQLDAAYTEDELRALLERAEINDYTLRVGPISGSTRGSYPGHRAPGEERLTALVSQFARVGFARELAQVPMHLFIYPVPGQKLFRGIPGDS